MRALVVDDDETIRLTIRLSLESHGYQVEEAEDGQLAVEVIQKDSSFEVVILDVNMPHKNGIQALIEIKNINPRILCFVVTAFSDVKDAVVAIKAGAYDYIEKPIDSDRVLSLIDEARAANALVEAAAHSAPQVKFAEGRVMIGRSTEIQKVFDIIFKLARVDTSVLIRGESGTGKELVARAIHYNSHRRKGPFVAINCAAIPESLIESELFGYEKGAFTGADKKKIGRFQYAEGGTLFLDEIGDVVMGMQVKLLRVLQEKVFTPVGSLVEYKSDVRVIAATHCNLEKMIRDGIFRSDLFYRLNVLPILLPPLRDRREDISSLCQFLIKKFNREHSRQVKKIDREALDILRVYGWPGNIRELENVIEHAFILEPSDIIGISALPQHILGENKAEEIQGSAVLLSGESQSFFSDSKDLNYPILKEKFEKDFLIRALKAFDGRINSTAANTKMTKVTLLRKLEKYGINPREYHPKFKDSPL